MAATRKRLLRVYRVHNQPCRFFCEEKGGCQIKRGKSVLGSSEDLFGNFVTHYHALFIST